jgi:hypothetical protein
MTTGASAEIACDESGSDGENLMAGNSCSTHLKHGTAGTRVRGLSRPSPSPTTARCGERPGFHPSKPANQLARVSSNSSIYAVNPTPRQGRSGALKRGVLL